MATIVEIPIEQKALTTVERANALQVTSVQLRGEAAELGRALAALEKEATEFFAPMKEKAFAAHKEICAKEKTVLDPILNAKRTLSRGIGSFDDKMEIERRAKEARLQEEERKRAEAEAAEHAQEQAIEDAIFLEQAGDVQGAAAVLNNPMPVLPKVVPVVVQSAIPKIEGVSGSTNWTFRITNVDLIPREYMMVDEKAIRGVVKSLKNKCVIPGIEVYPESGARFKA